MFIPKLFNEPLKSESVGRPMESGNARSVPEKFQKILVGREWGWWEESEETRESGPLISKTLQTLQTDYLPPVHCTNSCLCKSRCGNQRTISDTSPLPNTRSTVRRQPLLGLGGSTTPTFLR
jgi:hypothetical protein